MDIYSTPKKHYYKIINNKKIRISKKAFNEYKKKGNLISTKNQNGSGLSMSRPKQKTKKLTKREEKYQDIMAEISKLEPDIKELQDEIDKLNSLLWTRGKWGKYSKNIDPKTNSGKAKRKSIENNIKLKEEKLFIMEKKKYNLETKLNKMRENNAIYNIVKYHTKNVATPNITKKIGNELNRNMNNIVNNTKQISGPGKRRKPNT